MQIMFSTLKETILDTTLIVTSADCARQQA